MDSIEDSVAPDKSTKRTRVRLAILAVGIALIAFTAYTLQPPREIAWKFLEGKRPGTSRVTELGWLALPESGRLAGGPPKLMRTTTYHLSGRPGQIVERVRTEAALHGAMEMKHEGKEVFIGKGWILEVNEINLSLPEQKPSPNRIIPVMVTLTTSQEENWLGKASRWLRAR